MSGASPLHAARAPVAAGYACALVTAALAFEHPLEGDPRAAGAARHPRRRWCGRRPWTPTSCCSAFAAFGTLRAGAALAVRLVPVLPRARGVRGAAATPAGPDARRCRSGATPRAGAAQRLQIVRAVATGAMDRALDVAATLEVRGDALPAARG